MTIHRYFVTAGRGLEPILAAELEALGAGSARVAQLGVRVRGPIEFGYKICLWSRIASRVILQLTEVVAEDADALYEGVTSYAWEDHVAPHGSIAVDWSGQGAGVTDGRFGAQRVKDAIVDRFRARSGARPDVDRSRPDARIHVVARGRGVVLGLDFAGEALHRRGYRTEAGPAPLRETIAAALLRAGGWKGGALVDPLCGAGTIAIEAACIALDLAPGRRRDFAFERLLGHDTAAWSRLRDEAEERAAAAAGSEVVINAFDQDAAAIDMARRNAARAEVQERVVFEVAKLSSVRPAAERGLLATDPPHGHRLGDPNQARATYAALGKIARERFVGWRTSILAAEEIAGALGLPLADAVRIDHGSIPSLIVTADLQPRREPDNANPFRNRLRKNLKRIRPWALREKLDCYRIYDADVPEYNVAIDIYGANALVQEYEAPEGVDPEEAAARRDEAMAIIAETLGLSPEVIRFRLRSRGREQYERLAGTQSLIEVNERGHRFLVDLDAYQDTGLFPHHRDTRRYLAQRSEGRRFLNLFGYTGTATVYAARGGAADTTTVDLSRTYLARAHKNLELNDLPVGDLLKEDAIAWLERGDSRFGLIFCAPPSFSNSKAMSSTFDVHRDHAALVYSTMRRLEVGGELVFSTHARRFRLDVGLGEAFDVEEITEQTLPRDFQRRPLAHRCWRLRHRPK